MHDSMGCADAELRLDAQVRSLPATTAPGDFLARVHAKLPRERLGLDQRATAPSGWLSGPPTTSSADQSFLRFTRIAA